MPIIIIPLPSKILYNNWSFLILFPEKGEFLLSHTCYLYFEFIHLLH